MTGVPIGRAQVRREGRRVAMLGFGAVVADALAVAEEIDATLINMRFVKPLDEAAVLQAARNHALLDIYGSVTAGTFSATEPRYATRVRFDPRLEHKRPPNFPMTERYELEQWDPRWTVVSAD